MVLTAAHVYDKRPEACGLLNLAALCQRCHLRHDAKDRAQGNTTVPLFLEWERRAVRPATIEARLAPYLRYYSTRRPLDDHGATPSVLVVFDDELAATDFLRVVRQDMEMAGVEGPLWVSHQAALERLGPLGRTWQSPSVESRDTPLRL